MAPKLELSLGYLLDFAGGQGAGAGTYVTYAPDLDTCLALIRVAHNALVDEVTAMQGPNALIALDLILGNDPGGPSIPSGFIGNHSYQASIVTSVSTDDTVRITAGAAFVETGMRTTSASNVDLVGSGGAATLYVYINNNGMPVLGTATGLGVLDIWSAVWDGSKFTSVTALADYIPDGDDFQDCLTVVGVSGGPIPAQTHIRIADRFENLERKLAGNTTNIVSGATALGPIAIGGTEALPGLVTGDGTTIDTTTGLFRQAANVLAASVQDNEIWRLVELVTDRPQMLLRALADLTAPALGIIGDPDTGIDWVSADAARLQAGGREALRWLEDSTRAKVALAKDGIVTDPSMQFIGDSDTGIYSPGDNRMGFTTNGVLRAELDAGGNLDLPTNSRVHTTRNSFTVTASSLTNIDFTAEVEDIGGWHDIGTNPDRHTCPTDADGLYLVQGCVTFLESTAGGGGSANAGNFRAVQIEINGAATDLGGARVGPTGGGDTKVPVCDTIILAATDIVRLQAAHDNGGTMDVDAEFKITKIA